MVFKDVEDRDPDINDMLEILGWVKVREEVFVTEIVGIELLVGVWVYSLSES